MFFIVHSKYENDEPHGHYVDGPMSREQVLAWLKKVGEADGTASPTLEFLRATSGGLSFTSDRREVMIIRGETIIPKAKKIVQEWEI